MGNTLKIEKYNSNIGKTYKGYTITDWKQSDDHKHIIYTLVKDDQTIYRSHVQIQKDLNTAPAKRTLTMDQLVNGNIAVLQNKQICLVTNNGLIDINKGNLVASRSWYSNNLIHKTDSQYAIEKVYTNYKMEDLIWERPKYKLTQREKEFVNAGLLLSFKYIYRNKNQDICMSNRKPEKGAMEWVFNGPVHTTRLFITTDTFEFIKWSDDEPLLLGGLL